MASTLNVLGDIHGGAGEQSVKLYCKIAKKDDFKLSLGTAVIVEIDCFLGKAGLYLPVRSRDVIT